MSKYDEFDLDIKRDKKDAGKISNAAGQNAAANIPSPAATQVRTCTRCTSSYVGVARC
ncbi:hypothetical protein [Lactonifactor longoviformis]|uniref:hypothetical protein n=1 Tax=Lactonifactor longoviformis TaxID=341220 RepID=UPI0036F2A9AD